MGHFEESRAKAEAFAGKGYDLCKYGKYADALHLFQQASELDPSNFKYWYNAAVACDRIGDHVGMERASQKTIECDGTFVKGYVRLAKALVRQHKYDGAAEIVATGLLIDEHYAELLELKKLVATKQEEISMAEARKLADQLRQQKEREKMQTPAPPLSPTPRITAAPSVSAASSAVTAVGGNNNNKRSGGGIPASHREIPKLNNPHFADSGVAARSPPQGPARRMPQQEQRQREIPRLNNPHFGDSTGAASASGSNNSAHPRPSRLNQPYSRPIVPPNRDIDFKDQCGTFILAPTAVREMADHHNDANGGGASESAPPHHNHNRFLHQKPAAAATKPPPHKPTGRGGTSYFSLRRSTNNNNNHHNDDNPNNGGGRGALDI
jgi:hypothetical protein